MARAFDDTRLSRKDREALYRRQARLTRERDRFPFSNFNARASAERQAFDREQAS
jgi:hypothetical protein